MSFFILAPFTFFTEGVKITPTFLQSAVSVIMFDFKSIACKQKKNDRENVAACLTIRVNSDRLYVFVGFGCTTGPYKVSACCTLFPCISTGLSSNYSMHFVAMYSRLELDTAVCCLFGV